MFVRQLFRRDTLLDSEIDGRAIHGPPAPELIRQRAVKITNAGTRIRASFRMDAA
jgi:hypothetical protein